MMREVGVQLNIPMKVYGPETYATAIIPIALADDGGPKASELLKAIELPRVSTWKETKAEDVEKDPNFAAMQTNAGAAGKVKRHNDT